MIVLLRKIDKFAPSQKPYWFDAKSLRPFSSTSHKVNAMWVGRKNGLTVVTLGTYSLHTHARFRSLDMPYDADALITHADTRYGGDWLYRWDGLRFQENPTAPIRPLTDLIRVRRSLETILIGLPESMSEPGWLGPYYRTSTEQEEN